MNTDADPFAGYEPHTTGGTEDLGGDFDLAGAWESRKDWKRVWRKRSRDSIILIPAAMARTGDELIRIYVQS